MTAQGTFGLPRFFYPTLVGGKYHQANKVVPTALCNGNIIVNVEASPISYKADEMLVDAHPIVCRNCLTKSTGRKA
jgi:hypothetical protein